MFSFWKHPTTGVAFGNAGVRGAQGTLRGASLTLLAHAEQPLDAAQAEPSPAAERGKAALAKLSAAGRLSLERSVLLLPEDRVYTQMFSFPASSKTNLSALVHDAVARTIPEEFALLRVSQNTLQESAEQIAVGVAAVRKDALEGALGAFNQKGARALAVTTASCAIVAAHAQPKPASFFLIHETAEQTVVTLFHHLWPVDEALLPVGAPTDVLLRAAESVASEYREQGLTIEHVFFAGALGAVPSPADATLSVQTLFPDFRDRSWIGAACASVADPAKLSLNFVS